MGGYKLRRTWLKWSLALPGIFLIGASTSPKVGQPAPEYKLTTIDGTTITSDELKGQVVVLNYWATWCVPCRRELPTLDAYYERQKIHGLRVFAITTQGSLPMYQLKKLFAAMHITPVRKIKGSFDVMGGVPTNYVIDRAGRLRYAAAASFDLDDLNKVLVPLLQEPAPTT
jgi:cytochrome c biogenesis protein CcmG/thiol:disulfide interchange protein DsbE